jgi:esterase/lipase superfamily enzyme
MAPPKILTMLPSKGPVIRAICVVAVLGLIGFAITQVRILPPAKDDSVGVSDWLVVPIFYATNRTYAGDGKSVEYSEAKNGQSLLFGVKNVVVPFPEAPALDEQKLKAMGWQRIHTDVAGKRPPVPAEGRAVKDQLLGAKEVVDAFDKYSDSTQTKQALIFLHGCCATFDSSMNRAGKIAAHLGVPTVIYDWESPVGFNKYLQNETRVQQTADNFYKFLTNVEKISDPGEITLLGHSMGAMFVDEAMVRRGSNRDLKTLKPYGEVIMSNADVDAQAFLNHAANFAQNASKVRVYVSRNDDRLEASSFAHGGFARLGAPGGLVSDLIKIPGLDVIDITAGDTGHEIPFSVVAAMHDGKEPQLATGLNMEKLQPNFWELRKILSASKDP